MCAAAGVGFGYHDMLCGAGVGFGLAVYRVYGKGKVGSGMIV